MTKPFQISLVFAAVFLMGAVAGAFVAAWFIPEMPYVRAGDMFSKQQFDQVADMLQLTPEQRTRIQPIVSHAADEVQARRKDVRAAFERMQTDFRKELTSEQRARYDDWRKRARDADRRYLHWAREQRTHHPEFYPDPPSAKAPEGEQPKAAPAR